MIRGMIIRAVLALGIFFSTAGAELPTQKALPPYISNGVIDLQQSEELAKTNFEDLYFNTLLQSEKFFDDAYNNNLVISSEIDWDFAKNGVTFMKLIDFLENKNDPDATLMLAKLNELFYLFFHRHLSHIDLPREKQVDLVHALHYLFNIKNAKGEAVLRSHLTRIFVYSTMVEFMGLRYHEKKEILFFAFEDFRVALQTAVAGCADSAAALGFIDTFINDFAAYGMKEPIIQPKNFKKWVIIIAVIAAISGLSYYIATTRWEEFKTNVLGLVAGVTKTIAKTMKENFSDPTAKSFMDQMKKDGKALGKVMAGGFSEGFAYEPEEDEFLGAEDEDNSSDSSSHEDDAKSKTKSKAKGKASGKKVSEVPVKKRKPNRATKDLASDFAKNIGDGLTQKAAGLTREAVRGMVEVPTPIERRHAAIVARNAKKLALKTIRDDFAAVREDDLGDSDDSSILDNLDDSGKGPLIEERGRDVIKALAGGGDKSSTEAEPTPIERVGKGFTKGFVDKAAERKLRLARKGGFTFEVTADPEPEVEPQRPAAKKGKGRAGDEGTHDAKRRRTKKSAPNPADDNGGSSAVTRSETEEKPGWFSNPFRKAYFGLGGKKPVAPEASGSDADADAGLEE